MTLASAISFTPLLIFKSIRVKKPQGIIDCFCMHIRGEVRENLLFSAKKRIFHVEIILTRIVLLAIFITNPLRKM
jgi:hypothetical protein